MMWRSCKRLLATVWIVISSCSSPRGPDDNGDDRFVSVAYLKTIYERADVLIDRELSVRGTIVSTDQFGAFHNTIYVEDKTGAIALRAGLSKYYQRYYRGMTVTIACNSLVISNYGGMLQLGIWEDGRFAVIPEWRLPAVVDVEQGMDSSPVPTQIALNELTARYLGCYVALNNVQFADTELDKTWGDTESEVGVNRYLIDKQGHTLAVRTSPYADFAHYKLPSGSGYIEGILTYFNGDYQLEVNSHTSAIMEGPRF